MGTSATELSRKYASYSGTDIRISIEGEVVGEAQAISYAVQREKSAVYTMGWVDPRSFSRGKRAIAGTIVSMMFDEHITQKTPFKDIRFLADRDEMYPGVADLNDASSTADFETLDPTYVFDAGDLTGAYTVASAWYVDQLPPFDIVLVAANEYGSAATMRIYGVEILNEGTGMSVDDMNIENQMTYVARGILPWQKLGTWDFDTGAFSKA